MYALLKLKPTLVPDKLHNMIKLKQLLSEEPTVWFPLVTEQLRLRSLTEVTLLSPASSSSVSSFHLTLHESSSSDPFFTSRQARVQNQRAAWCDLERGTQEFGGVTSVILKLWRDGECQLRLGLTFSGLVCVGNEVTGQLMENCAENTLVFRLRNHLFVCNQYLKRPLNQERYLEVPVAILDEVSSSYDFTSLKKVVEHLRDLEEKEKSELDIKKEVSVKMEMRTKNKKKKKTLGKVVTDLTLQVKARERKNKPTTFQLKREIENLKFKIDFLKQKKTILQNDVDYNKFRRDHNTTMLEEISGQMSNVWSNEGVLAKDKEEFKFWAEVTEETRDVYGWTQQKLNNKIKHTEDLERGQSKEGNEAGCCICC